jgi:hypothetical protein
MFDGSQHAKSEAGRVTSFAIDQDDEKRAARARKNGQTCATLAAGWSDYLVRCTGTEGAERERVRAEMLDLTTRAVRDEIGACKTTDGSQIGPEAEDVGPCLEFFASGTCEILDYDPAELATGMLDFLTKRPTRPQPHLKACAFLFN